MDHIVVKLGDINNDSDAQAMLSMLAAYMNDPMGGERILNPELARQNIEGLRKQCNYLFFIAWCNDELAGVANCFVGFSTFKAKPLINIHDFSVDPRFRRKGIGEAMLKAIADFCRKNDFCKISLEVRYDNAGAQRLYQRFGFSEGTTPYHFWEMDI
jgi:ribosomal protein S18 acetylase RimI-like enzyme